MKDQNILINQCKERVGGKNLANELADLLGINLDAAYRRMRGVTALTFDEIKKICQHFNLSFDSIINYQGKLVPVQFNSMFHPQFKIMDYLKNMSQEIKRLSSKKDSSMILTAMDLPFFRQFGFPVLTHFKLFFWQRSVLNMDEFKHKKFDWTEIEDEYREITESIYHSYHGVNSIEIWAPESLDSTLKQIRYFIESGLFKSKQSAYEICDDIDRLLNKLENEAERGLKYTVVDGTKISSSFKIYQSDMFMSNNCIQAELDGKKYTYVSFNSFNSLMSFSPNFSEECFQWIEQIRLKSILLSELSEKLRYQFFKTLRTKLQNLRDNIT